MGYLLVLLRWLAHSAEVRHDWLRFAHVHTVARTKTVSCSLKALPKKKLCSWRRSYQIVLQYAEYLLITLDRNFVGLNKCLCEHIIASYVVYKYTYNGSLLLFNCVLHSQPISSPTYQHAAHFRVDKKQ